MGRRKTWLSRDRRPGPLAILAGGAPASAASPRLVPTAIYAKFLATARNTGDRTARSPGALRKQAPGEAAGCAAAPHASAARTGSVVLVTAPRAGCYRE